ncbi:MAG: hypothetical protein JW808_03945 [Victivallales bacterium]|nr:hypothetical protein [Victivallales bacterium]
MQTSEIASDEFFKFAPPFSEEQATSPENEARSAHKAAYFSLLSAFQSVCLKLKESDAKVDGNHLKNLIDQMVCFVKEDERMLLSLANAPYSFIMQNTGQNVFPTIVIHGVNVLIYSLKIALDLGVPDMRLPYICAAGMYHRLGLLDLDDQKLYSYTNTNDKKYLREVERLEQDSEKYVKRILMDDFHIESIQYLINLIREDKQILQKTSLREAMYQYSMLIHLCYEFEKLTHQPGYGEALSPVDAMRKVRDDMGNCFSPEIVKMFFNKLSIYPLGTFVKLSSGETAKIVQVNEQALLRPEVLVVLDGEGREKLSPGRLNLREKPNIYIRRAVIDSALTEKFIDLF